MGNLGASIKYVHKIFRIIDISLPLPPCPDFQYCLSQNSSPLVKMYLMEAPPFICGHHLWMCPIQVQRAVQCYSALAFWPSSTSSSFSSSSPSLASFSSKRAAAAALSAASFFLCSSSNFWEYRYPIPLPPQSAFSVLFVRKIVHLLKPA